jgi:hypothetical protein
VEARGDVGMMQDSDSIGQELDDLLHQTVSCVLVFMVIIHLGGFYIWCTTDMQCVYDGNQDSEMHLYNGRSLES